MLLRSHQPQLGRWAAIRSELKLVWSVNLLTANEYWSTNARCGDPEHLLKEQFAFIIPGAAQVSIRSEPDRENRAVTQGYPKVRRYLFAVVPRAGTASGQGGEV
jgi:hypothetical protein